MKRVLVIASKENEVRSRFIEELQQLYKLDPTQVESVENIPPLGIAYLIVKLNETDSLLLEFLSENRHRNSAPKLLANYFKNAEKIITVGVIPDLFKPYIMKDSIVFSREDFSNAKELIEVVHGTLTAREAVLNAPKAAPAATPGTLARLRGIFSSSPEQQKELPAGSKTADKLKPSVGPQDWQAGPAPKNIPGVKPRDGNGNDGL